MQVEIRVVPGTPNRAAHQKPVSQRGTVVGPDGIDGGQFVAAPCQQHWLTVYVSEQHGALGDARERDPVGEIRLVQSIGCLAH